MGQHWEMRLHLSLREREQRLQWSEKGQEDMWRKRELLIVVSVQAIGDSGEGSREGREASEGSRLPCSGADSFSGLTLNSQSRQGPEGLSLPQ